MRFTSMPTSHSAATTVVITLLFVVSGAMLMPAGDVAAQQPPAVTSTDPFATLSWGDVTDGLQLGAGAGVNTESLTETVSMRYLTVQMRNVSDAPVSVDFDHSTYDFEYEIDGTWCAFERMAPVRTPLNVMYTEGLRGVSRPLQTIAAGSQRFTV